MARTGEKNDWAKRTLGWLVTAFTPPVPALLAMAAVSALGLAWAFLGGNKNNPVAYAAYALSAYALACVCTTVVRAVRGCPLDRLVTRLPQNALVERLLGDLDFRAKASFSFSSVLRVVWAITNAVSGVLYASAWNVTLAAYYLLLAIVRGGILDHVRAGDAKGPRAGGRIQIVCGAFLALTVLALSGIGVLVMHHEGGFSYTGSLIYAVALYAFYSLISSVVTYVRGRHTTDPVPLAMNAVRFAEALVSMFSLEIAMLSTFGTLAEDADANVIMVGASGGAIAVVILALAVNLIAHGVRALRTK